MAYLLVQVDLPSQEGTGLHSNRLPAELGWAAMLLGLSWLAGDILATLAWFYLQGPISNAALWQAFIRLNEMRLFTAASTVALALVGYRAARGRRPRRTALLVVVGLFLAGAAVFSVLRPLGFFGLNSNTNPYLLQGSIMAIGGTVFMMSGERGFKAAGFLAGTLGVVLLYMGGLTFPMGFVDYVERTAGSPYFVYFGWPQGHFWIGTSTYHFLGDTTAVLLGIFPFVLAAWVIKAYAGQRGVAAAKAADMILRICGAAFGTVLIAMSCFAIV
ncbi:MAG TPA: hypothetical protein VMS77_06380, partial [Conexivisphaerales archaeon]|nr:hypothetical protein [Conexivisphaerales archaeon]